MKAGINGALNMSILDGWFDEADDAAGGWAIGDRDLYSPDRDDAHAAGIYSALENEIVPLYYDRDQGVPEQWMRRVKQSLRQLSANFNCQRMVDEYRTQLYDPAHRAFEIIAEGRFQAVRERVEVPAIAEHVRATLRERAAQRETRVDVDVAADVIARGDPVAVEQVIENLVDNAIKYGKDGGGQVRVTGRRQGNRVELEVVDDGPGIEAEHLPRLFERFYRVDAGRSRERGGTGLGLAIVKHLVESMGGTVEVDSEVGRGTTFRVEWPAWDATAYPRAS